MLVYLFKYKKNINMAINVDSAYKTSLLILNKEERGYVTPDEFNKIGTQVQLEVFEKYSEDLNQQLRVMQTDTDYADRISNIDEKLAIFKTTGSAEYDNSTVPTNPYFVFPFSDIYGNASDVYRIGAVVYNSEVELQRLQRMDFYNIQKSPLTKSTLSFPTYLLENNKLFIKPDSITSGITIDYLRKPLNVRWGYSIGQFGQFVYDPTPYNANQLNTGTGTLTSSITINQSDFNDGVYTGTIGDPGWSDGGASVAGLELQVTVQGGVATIVSVINPGVTTSGTYSPGDILTVDTSVLGGTGVLQITLQSTDFMGNSTYGSTQIELHESEQTNFIINTLYYFGVVIKDPQVIQVASSKIAQEENNSKI